MAAVMLDRLEARGKTVTPGNIAFYTLQALKSGRRSGYAGRMDAMSPAAALGGMVKVRSMDESMGVDADADDPSQEMTLHDILAGGGEDVDSTAARELDWGAALAGLDDRRISVLRETAAGYGPNDIAKTLGISAPRVIQLRQSCGNEIKDTWGGNGIDDVVTPSKWRAGLRAAVERRAGRYERAWNP
jgi:DNA-binding CsgD family transcriptional regulator